MKISKLLGFVAVLTTLAVAPHIFFDPINFPKLLVLVIGLITVNFALLVERKKGLVSKSPSTSSTHIKFTLEHLVLVAITAVVFLSIIGNNYQRDTQYLGTWGRNTGVILWLSLLAVFYIGWLALREAADFYLVESFFIRCSYIVYFYALLQNADLDPISWSSKDPTSFLGNINFVSAFLGISASLMISIITFRFLPIYTKLFYLAVCGVYIHYMFSTNSLQGLACFIIGTSVSISIKIVYRLKLSAAIPLVSLSAFLLSFACLGVFGVGPLGPLLQQQTMSYRLDYWRAGIEMVKSNYLLGIGLDNYGSYYREFRSFEAATSTGPDRVTNTAHNIFIDFGAGTGLFGGLLLFMLFMIVMLRSFRNILQMRSQKMLSLKSLGSGKSNLSNQIVWEQLVQSYLAVTVSYFVFMLVSINQIGVSVWGFLFLGALFKLVVFTEGIPVNISNPKLSRVNLNRLTSVLIAVFLVASLFFKVVPAAKVETLFLRALESNEIDTLFMLATKDLTIPTYYEVAIEEAIKKGARSKETLVQNGKDLLENDPRNFYALALLINLKPDGLNRDEYAKRLLEIDPQNQIIREWIKGIE